MDSLDTSIIQALQEDARKPFTEIANALNVVEGTVRKRVAKLVGEGALRLQGTYDFHKAGFEAPAFVSISVRPGHLDEVAAELAKIPEVSYLVAVTGDTDLLVELVCENQNHLLNLMSNHIHKIEGITSTNTTMILRIYKELLPLIHTNNGHPEE